MSRMKIIAMKMTDDVDSIKVAYMKNGRLFVRSGVDGFAKGHAVQGKSHSLGTMGFRKVDPQPVFRDAMEIIDNLHRFEIDFQKGTITYHE